MNTKELQRLLGTAKNKERRNLIENALTSLDAQRVGSAGSSLRAQSLIPALHPTAHAHTFGNHMVCDILFVGQFKC